MTHGLPHPPLDATLLGTLLAAIVLALLLVLLALARSEAGVLAQIRAWLRLYTLPAAAPERQQRREEVFADATARIDTLVVRGYTRRSAAFLVWCQHLAGVPLDVLWSCEALVRRTVVFLRAHGGPAWVTNLKVGDDRFDKVVVNAVAIVAFTRFGGVSGVIYMTLINIVGNLALDSVGIAYRAGLVYVLVIGAVVIDGVEGVAVIGALVVTLILRAKFGYWVYPVIMLAVGAFAVVSGVITGARGSVLFGAALGVAALVLLATMRWRSAHRVSPRIPPDHLPSDHGSSH